jgi:conjugal transfer pilus assembly protein TraD
MSMSTEDRFNQYIENNPRQSLQIVVFMVTFVWLSPIAVLGLVLYIVLSNLEKVKWWMILGSGLMLTAIAILISGKSIDVFVHEGFFYNKIIWKYLYNNQPMTVLNIMFAYALNYVVTIPVLLAGLLSTINLIDNNPYKETMKSLQEGKRPKERKEISAKKTESKLKKIDESKFNSTVLGVSKYTGNCAVIPDDFVNQLVLVLGTTGGGKTITLRRFYHRAITKGYPLVVIDGKPSEDNVSWLKNMAEQNNRQFYGFNCANFFHYDCLAKGGYTELKDKIISLKDQWESDYYRTIAEDYLQTTLRVLLKSGKAFDLKMIASCLNYDTLLNMVHELNDEDLFNQVNELANYESKELRGLQAHLKILINSELGNFFVKNENTFSLPQVINENAVVYFALPALRFPSFSTVLGKLIINDLKAVIDRYSNQDNRVFMVFDEFSVFAGDQVMNLVNMGRGKGVHAVFGTQGLGDLEKVNATFKDQVLNCVNTIICHRLNDQNSAEGISNWVGTEHAMAFTAQISDASSDKKGSVRWGKEFIVHPDAIKQGLQTGEAFYVTKVGRFWQDKVKVKYT